MQDNGGLNFLKSHWHPSHINELIIKRGAPPEPFVDHVVLAH